MSESVAEPTGPSLEQILWASIDQWSMEPALVDRSEFARHIEDAWGGDVPTEAFVERFFEGRDPRAAPPAMAEAVARVSKKRLHVYEFDLNQVDYVVIEDKDDLVVVSDFGQFALPSNDLVSRAVEAAVLPDSKDPVGGGGQYDRKSDGSPRAYLVRQDGEIVGVDVSKLARALEQARVQQVEAPAVGSAALRMMPFNPQRKAVSVEREQRILRQDARMTQLLAPPPARRGSALDDSASPAAPPASAEQTVLLLMPDGSLARPAMGSATRWQDMVSDWIARASLLGTGATAVGAGARFTVQSDKVVAVFTGRESARTGAPGGLATSAEAGFAGLSAVRGLTADVRVLKDDELALAIAAGARLLAGVSAPKDGGGQGFWIQPESLFRPSANDRETLLKAPHGELVAPGEPMQLGQVTGDPWADWALQTGGKLGELALAADKDRNLGRLDDSRAMLKELRLFGQRAAAFRAPDGAVLLQRGDGALVRLASMHRNKGAADADVNGPTVTFNRAGLAGNGAVALRSGALPATALAALSMALERTAAANGFKLPATIRLLSDKDALGVGAALDRDLPADSASRRGVRLMAAPTITANGQVGKMLVSMPFPSTGELVVGSDLSDALQAWLSTPAVPVGAPGGSAFHGDGSLDAASLHALARAHAGAAASAFSAPGVSMLLASGQGRGLGSLPKLLAQALEQSGDWAAGPGAQLPGGVQQFVLSGPFDLPELVAAGALPDTGAAYPGPRPAGLGEHEIVIPLPLWAQMGRGRISGTDQVLLPRGAPMDYAPPLGAYRLVAPAPGLLDLTGGAPEGTPGIVKLMGPTDLQLDLTRQGGVQANSLGGRFPLARVPVDDGETLVTRRGRVRIGAPLDPEQAAAARLGAFTLDGPLVAPPVYGGADTAPAMGAADVTIVNGRIVPSSMASSAPMGALAAPKPPPVPDVSLPSLEGLRGGGASSGVTGTYLEGTFRSSSPSTQRPMAGALNSALRLSGDVSGRALPGSTALGGSFGGSFAGAQGSMLSSGTAMGDTTLGGNLVAGERLTLSSGGYAPGETPGAASYGSPGPQTLVSGGSVDAGLSGLPAGAWSGLERTQPGYVPWTYSGGGTRFAQQHGGVDLSGLGRPSYPSLPTSLRFRYVGAPLWWTGSRGVGSSDSDTDFDEQGARNALRSGLRAANSAAAIWRSLLVANASENDAGALDRGWEQHANTMGSASSKMYLVAPGPAAASAGGRGAESVYIAIDQSGRAGATSEQALLRQGKADRLEMSIVAAIPSAPPSMESMATAQADIEPRTRRTGQGHEATAKHADEGVSHSKIEGSVDAVAQRIYHRIRQRIASDRERFGG